MSNLIRLVSRTIVVVLFLAAMMQCSHSEPELAPKIAGLIGTWRLVEPDSSYAVTLTFDLDTANPPHDVTPFNARGKSSVNDYTIRLFATIDGTLVSDKLVSTERAGTTNAAQFEQSYFKNLRAVVRYELPTETLLRIYHGGNQPHVMTYKKQN